MLEIAELLILTASITLIVVIKLIDKNPHPILGIYQKPNGLYWLKVAIMYIVLSLRKVPPLKKEDTKKLYLNIDKPQELSAHGKPVDAVYFNGASQHGDHLIVNIARRNNSLVDGFLYLKITDSSFGLLESPKLPYTDLYNEAVKKEYTAEGIKIIPVEPMKKWTVFYDGKMKEYGDCGKIHHVKIDGIWTSDLPYFNYDVDMDPLCMAKSMAYERWSLSYFKDLKSNHQTHYEQFGNLKAKVTVDDRNYEISLDTVRDHTFGDQREWRQFHRYGLHFVSVENGDRFSVGKICLPISFSRLTVGYLYSAKYRKIFPVQACDLELYQHGEFGTPPKDFAFSFIAGNEKYTVKVTVADSPHFYLSKDCEAKFFEMFSLFEINGVKGWGSAEWQYRNIVGKDAEKKLNRFTFYLK